MPYSGTTFDDMTEYLIRSLPIQSVLDIGVGEGKYGRLLRQYQPHAHVTGVEVMSDYITRFNLNEFYDRIINCNILDFMKQEVDTIYDLVIMGDVIEHLPKSGGTDVLHFYVHRARYLMILYPERTFQGTYLDNPHEAHISVWTKADFSPFDSVYLEREAKPPAKGIKILVGINGFMLDTQTAPLIQAVLEPYLPHSALYRVSRSLYRRLLPMSLRRRLNLSGLNRKVEAAHMFTPPTRSDH